ncbi:MAG: hypothetical protein JRJ69_10380 [Deltaproteobacteria bacterium]|nr:hypothetical protein [Deltaproteobacteria bacterium]
MKVKKIESWEDLEKVPSILIETKTDGSPRKASLFPNQDISKWGTKLIAHNYPYTLPPTVTQKEATKLSSFLTHNTNRRIDFVRTKDWEFSSSTYPFSLSLDNQHYVYQIWDFDRPLPTANYRLPRSSQAYWMHMGTGFDPEFFVFNRRGNLVPAFKFLPTLEEQEAKMADYLKKYRVYPDSYQTAFRKAYGPYWDGFAAEFQTDPYYCFAYTVDSLQASFKQLINICDSHSYKVKPIDTVNIPNIDSYPPQFKELGCDPSMNAYDQPQNRCLDPNMPIRTAGFHIHFGLKEFAPKSNSEIARLIRMLDYYVAIPNMCILEGIETTKRRKYYGLPGEFRRPPHGIEYRVLSSATMYSPVLVHLALETGRAVIDAALTGNLSQLEREAPDPEKVYHTLLNYDYATARKWLPEITGPLGYYLKYDLATTINELFRIRIKDAFPRWSACQAWKLDSWSSHSSSDDCAISHCTNLLRRATNRKAKVVSL